MLQLHGFSIGRNVIRIQKIFYIIQQRDKEVLCVGFWVKCFKVIVDQDKIVFIFCELAVYFSQTHGPRSKRNDSWTRWPCWNLGSTGLTTGSNLSSTSIMLESRPVCHVFKRIRSLDIYVQSTDFNVSN